MKAEPDGVIVTKEECLFLAASVGMDHFFGVFPELDGEPEDETYQKLFRMVKDGIFRVSGDALEPDGYLEEAFQCIRDSRNILVVYPDAGCSQPFYFYLSGGRAVCLEECLQDPGEMRVSMAGRDQLWERFEELCELPDCTFPAELMESLDVREEAETQFRSMEELLGSGRLLLAADLLDAETEEVQMRLLLTEDDLFPGLVLCAKNWKETYRYSRGRMRECVERLADFKAGGKENGT